jgi:hypothetical protein
MILSQLIARKKGNGSLQAGSSKKLFLTSRVPFPLSSFFMKTFRKIPAATPAVLLH